MVSSGFGGRGGDILHALGAATPVAIMKFETLALEDEGAHAILVALSAGTRSGHLLGAYSGSGRRLERRNRHFIVPMAFPARNMFPLENISAVPRFT
jgi:hypothetical protein